MKRERGDLRRRVRLLFGWFLTITVVAVYFLLPEGDSVEPLPTREGHAEVGSASLKLDVIDVSPADANPGSAITVDYIGADDERGLAVTLGKEELPILARRRGSVVARLPADTPLGRYKIRVTSGSERSKPYDIRIKGTNWRKPYRSLVGGLALLVFGIGVLARGAREAAGRQSARVLARVAGRGPAALVLGATLGALAQSTTAAAGLLAGLVASSLLAIVPAASAFLGAQLGAASAPLVTGLIDPREGLLIIAVGVLWLAFAHDRRAKALARFVLGAGLIAFGLQTLRPGFEPLLHDPNLLSLIGSLRAGEPGDMLICAMLGAALVALLQGPAPVVVLVLVLAQTTAQWDLRTSLGVLAGSGFGSAVGALLTTPGGRRGRRLAELYLTLGALGTLFTACTVDVWVALTDLVVPGVPHEVAWGKRILLPNIGLHLGVAFAFSQLASALLLLPFVPRISKVLARIFPEPSLAGVSQIGDVQGVVQRGLSEVLAVEREGIRRLSELALDGRRDAGGFSEHRLADAHSRLQDLLAGPVLALPDTMAGTVLSRVAFSSLGFLRALEELHRQAERLTDSRLALGRGEGELPPLPPEDAEIISEMHAILERGLATVAESLEFAAPIDLEAALAREIQMNALEARTRSNLQSGTRDPISIQGHLGVLELVGAYETSGNQLYRLTEAFAEWSGPTSLAPSAAETG